MTIAGTLVVSASDDPRFHAGDSIGIVIDAGLDITVTSNVEVSAPVASAPTTEPTDTTPSTVDEVGTGPTGDDSGGTTPATA